MSIKLFTLFLLLTVSSVAFQDSDLDGVEDTVDRCPDSSFDELVDKEGCSENQTAQLDWGRLTLRINNDFYSDPVYGDDQSLSLSAYYNYHAWSLALSNYQNNIDSRYSEEIASDGNDCYLTLAYLKSLPQAMLQLSVGTRFVSDMEVTTIQTIGGKGGFDRNATQVTQTETIKQNNDYYTGIHINYQLNSKQNLFGQVGYTLSGNEENYAAFSLGTGYSLGSQLYTALSYHYTEASIAEGEDQQSVNWLSSYGLSQSVFGTLNGYISVSGGKVV